jgi:hypothetical protein
VVADQVRDLHAKERSFTPAAGTRKGALYLRAEIRRLGMLTDAAWVNTIVDVATTVEGDLGGHFR